MTAMHTLRSFRILYALICLSFFFPAEAQQKAAQSGTFAVYFSPHGAATGAINHSVDNAKESILVQAYSFTSVPVAEALIRAHKRGVKVQVLLDRSQRTQKNSIVDILVSAGIPTLIDAAHAIAHNKVMIIDNEIVVTGSFNFTKAAEERNAENLLIIHSKELSARYLANWQAHQRHSMPYSQRLNLK
ncbi:MAG: phospholipase D family protein [Ignavibacteriales bacterium]|nr:phospholipase D family protein [Ignavibacteriales bacterium]